MPHLEVDVVTCPFTGSFDFEQAHLLSHSAAKEYRSEFWLRMLGFSDGLVSPRVLNSLDNVWPLQSLVHKLLDRKRPEAVIWPSEDTAIEAIRVAELAHLH